MSRDAQLTKQYDALLAVNKMAMSGADFDSVMNAVVQGTLSVLPQAAGAIIELAEGDDMVYAAVSGAMTQHLGLRLKAHGSLSGLCFEQEKLLYCSDSENDTRVNREACRRVGLRSMIVAPLLYRKRCVGVLKVYSDKPNAFSDNDLLLTHSFVTMISAGFGGVAEMHAMETLQDLINTVTHELRTPLTSLKGALEMMGGLHKVEMPRDVQRLLDIALRGSSRMMLLIDDLLTAGKLQSGETHFLMHEEDLGKMLEEAVEGIVAYRDTIHFNLEKPAPGTKIRVDRHRFLQIMANLLSNAAKFSREGGKVTIAAKPANGKVIVAVQDNGVGIPEAFQSRIFQKFAQAENQGHQGSGLGLSITKDFVERMQGRIWFESQEGKGTTFFIEFR